MNFIQIEYFLALCEYKNYSETARRLYVSQSTISKQISALENDLGFKLFERSSGNLLLTMQGAIMKKAYFDAMESIHDARNEALNYSRKIADTVNISILEGSDIGFSIGVSLNEMISHFKEHMDIKVSFLPYKALNENLVNNLIDIGITLINEVDHHPSLEFTKLRTLPMGLIAHRSLNIIKNGQPDYETIYKMPFFFTTHGSFGFKKFLNQLSENLEIPADNFRVVPNIPSILMNVELKQGITLAVYTPQIEKNENLTFYPLEDMHTTIVAAWNKSNTNNSRIRIIKKMRRSIIENGYF